MPSMVLLFVVSVTLLSSFPASPPIFPFVFTSFPTVQIKGQCWCCSFECASNLSSVDNVSIQARTRRKFSGKANPVCNITLEVQKPYFVITNSMLIILFEGGDKTMQKCLLGALLPVPPAVTCLTPFLFLLFPSSFH